MKAIALHQNNILKASSILLILLWSSTGLSKILEFAEFKQQVITILGENMAKPVSIAIPSLELTAAMTIPFGKTRTFGLYLSLILMATFTAYVILVITGYFGPAPCTCGGVITALSWKQHLIVNIILLLIVLYSLFTLKKRKEAAVTP
jgi:hypothetical protein